MTVDCSDWLESKFWKTADESDIKRCLDAGRNTEDRDSNGLTRLHVAVVVSPVETLRALDRRRDEVARMLINADTTTINIACGRQIHKRSSGQHGSNRQSVD